ncbi:MAG TPA: winged helix-turn-helix domain-containing protein [Gemmatimonadales bacterium]|nr:winged helix-turn-helix domain-containing protein [Gemmatimonadales bacterium]
MRILIIEDDAAGALTPSAGAAVADGPEAEALLDQLRRRLDGNRGADSLWGGMARFGEVVVEYATQRIVRAGRYIPVTPKELRLLYALMRREGRVVTRPELMEEVWGPDAAIGPRVIDTHIARLRRKLEAEPAQPRHILTALNLGYRFQQ